MSRTLEAKGEKVRDSEHQLYYYCHANKASDFLSFSPVPFSLWEVIMTVRFQGFV